MLTWLKDSHQWNKIYYPGHRDQISIYRDMSTIDAHDDFVLVPK